ncbi:MAG: hypothetical protein QXT73_07785, partial [Candidatus Methanomethylicaceae archaeon]
GFPPLPPWGRWCPPSGGRAWPTDISASLAGPHTGLPGRSRPGSIRLDCVIPLDVCGGSASPLQTCGGAKPPQQTATGLGLLLLVS